MKFNKILWLLQILMIPLLTTTNIIRISVKPDHAIIPKDEFVEIVCNINVPDAKYSWLVVSDRSTTEQPVVQSQYITFGKNDALFLKHDHSVSGKYRCKAIIPTIGVVISQIIQVDLADMFVSKFSSPTFGNGYYKIGDRALLVCEYSALLSSEIDYKWFMRGRSNYKQISQSNRAVFHQNGRFLELKINKESFGRYFCKVTYARFGVDRTSSDIKVLQFDENDERDGQLLKWVAKPMETLSLDNRKLIDKRILQINGQNTLIAKEGINRLELICIANNNESDAVEILWFKDKVRIDRAVIQNERFIYEISGQGTLVLFNISSLYDGFYMCQASLKRNSSVTITDSFKLQVQSQLRFIDKPSSIVTKEKNAEILLVCNVSSDESQNKVVWRKNGEPILTNSYIHQDRGFLRISKLLSSDEGIFQCLADNEFSSIQAITQIKISKAVKSGILDHLPEPVRDLHVKAVSFGTLNISWQHAVSGFETILYYEIILLDLSKLSFKNPRLVLKAERLESSLLVKDLVPDSFYKILVFSINGTGRSYPAVINSSPRVLSRAPTAPPTNVHITEVGSTVATILWSSPDINHINGELIGYIVTVTSNDMLYSKNMDVKNGRNLQLSDLTPNTKYLVTVQASTRGGLGPHSSRVTFETKDVPNGNDDYYRGRFHGIKVMGKKTDKKKYSKIIESPSQIKDLRSKCLNTSIALSWSHPVEGGQVQKYTIKWGKVYPGPHQFTVNYPASAYVIENLESRTQYMIKIIPINDYGEGKESLFSAWTGSTDIKKIPIPLNLGINQIGMTWAIISWEDPTKDLSNTRIYQIQYSSLSKDFQSTESKNSTDIKVQITGLRPSTLYSFSVRTGDLTLPRDGEYISREWMWSEWSLKESFSTMGEKPTSSPRDLKLVTVGLPDVRNNDVYTKIALSWTSPNKNFSHRSDEITQFTIYFTSEPKYDLRNWYTQALPSDQYTSEIILNGSQKIYYFRVGCKTKNYKCPLSELLLYKTSDFSKKHFGLLRVPEKYRYTVDIPSNFLTAEPVQTLDAVNDEPVSPGKEAWWIMTGSGFGAAVFLLVLMICVFIWHRRRSQNSFTGYKLGTKSSIQHIGGAGLLLSNQSPALSNGKVSPHYVSNFSQSLKTPDLFPHPEPHFGDLESDSNQDNDSLRFASVSQHHLASTSGVTNMFNPTIQNHSLIRSHPQMVSYYSDIPSHSKSAINASTILNPLVNNSISIPIQIQDNSLQRAQHTNPVYSYQGHPFTQHLLSSGAGMPICSSSCLQPIHLAPQMLNTSHEVHSPTNFSNTPRVNASELASHTSSEDIRPVMNCSRPSENDMYPYYGSAGNSTNKSQKTAISSKSHSETLRNSDVIKSGIDSSQSESEVAKAFSTEELSQEMANLEGLMKDLNAITQKEFEC